MTTDATPDIHAIAAGAERATLTRLETHIREAERAAQTFETKRRQLVDNGRPIYTDHAEREAALLAELDQAVAAAEARGAALAREAEATLDREENLDPADRLTPGELDQVNARRALVKEDCEDRPVPEIGARLRLALAGDDRAALYLLSRYGGRRLEREQAQGHGGRPEMTALADLLRQAARRFTDPTTAATARGTLAGVRRFRAALAERSGSRERTIQRTVNEMRASGRYSL